MRAEHCVENQVIKEKLGEQTQRRGKAKQQRAKLAEKDGVKTAMERAQRQTRGGDWASKGARDTSRE